MYNCVIIIGPPCSGKSTIGKKLAELIHYKYISSGDIARELSQSQEMIDKLNNGEMFDEDTMRSEIKKILSNTDNVVLDGFPRFEDQLVWLMKQFTNANYTFVHVDASLTEIARRAIGRDRGDDKVLDKRMCYYIKNTKPILDVISSNGYTILEVEN